MSAEGDTLERSSLLDSLVAAGASSEDLEAVTRPLLQALGDATGLESTYLTRIVWDEDVQRIVYARNAGELRIDEGLEVPWSDTLCRRALESGQICTSDVPGIWGDSGAAQELGIQTYVSAPITMPDGHIVGTLCGASSRPVEVDGRTAALLRLFTRVITDQMLREEAARRAEDRAAAAERDLRERVAFVAQSQHELKGPLMVLAGWLSTMERRELDTELVDEGLTAMRRAVDTLRVRVDRLLDESRAATISRDLVVHPIDLVAFVSAFVDDLPDGEHRFACETDACAVMADTSALQIVLEHLVENAVKYSPSETIVTVRCGPADDGLVRLDVVDEGPGIPDDVDLFEPFSQANRTSAGVGLGLHIVKSLVEAMGGKVRARRNPDVGSTFTVLLPAGGPERDEVV